MHAREDPHRYVSRVVTHEHFIDLEYRSQLSRQSLGRNMRQIEIDLVLAADPMTLKTNLKYFASRNIARNKVPVGRIFFLEEVPSLFFGDLARRPRITVLSRDPHAPAFAACGFAHQTEFVFARNRRWM